MCLLGLGLNTLHHISYIVFVHNVLVSHTHINTLAQYTYYSRRCSLMFILVFVIVTLLLLLLVAIVVDSLTIIQLDSKGYRCISLNI